MAQAVAPLLIIGGVIQGASQIFSGIAANRAAKRNAAYLEQDAEEARRLGAIEAEFALEDGRRNQGAAIAEAGASGFGVDGTIQDGLATLARASAIDAGQARYEARRTERRLKIQAGEERVRGRTSLITGIASGVGSVVTGASSAIIASG